jgi:hypothetical protein
VSESRLLLISRDDILGVTLDKEVNKLFRTLARLTRGGFQLLATAPQPEDWSREHGGPDDALLGPESIRKRLADFGGTLEGVYYVPRSLLTQKRNREEALRDMMERYSIDPGYCFLYSSSQKFVDAALGLGIEATYLGGERRLIDELRKLLRNFNP